MDVDEEPPKTAASGAADNKNVIPSASADSQSKHPSMALAQSIHRLTMIKEGKLAPDYLDAASLKKSVAAEISGDSNPSLYTHISSLLGWDASVLPAGSPSVEKMEEDNAAEKKKLEEAIAEAKESAGDMEVLEATSAAARFAAKSLPKTEARKAYAAVLALPKISSGRKIDTLVEEARVCAFHGDGPANAEVVGAAALLAEDGGDWDRRNRLKVYNALVKLQSRDIKTVASLLIDCIATFSCNELCSYTDFIMYTVISNILHLPRTELKEKIIDGPEVISVMSEIPAVFDLVNSLYECDYKKFLKAMVEIQPLLVADRYLQPHAGYILRELHVLGYKQFLDSYKSVRLDSMAASFGVGVNFLDLQLSRFIAAGRLTAKIDKFGGVVETNRPDMKNSQYRDMIQKGDLLLNRIQKLTRVVDM